MSGMRKASDSMGSMEVPAGAYYGAQTQRAVENFRISGEAMPRAFIHAHVLLKKAAAMVNRDLGLLKPELAAAIVRACEEILDDAKWSLDQFPVDVYQTGSGTSTNMNVNEVLASRANEILGGKRGETVPVHPNDHVNMGQSSNDTIPSSLRLMVIQLIRGPLSEGVQRLWNSLDTKSRETWSVIKTGRTHLQDATPIRLGQEFLGHAHQMKLNFERIIGMMTWEMNKLPLGGTAVGTGINTHPEFAGRVCKMLSQSLGTDITEGGYHFASQSTLDAPVSTHAHLKTLAVSLTKIANDIRWMGSGPRAGLGEIEIPAVQPGSSIMPGKVNPVICESVLMVCQRVIGNDAALTAAATQCNFELAMSLLLAAKLLHESITLLANACTNFATKCIDGIKATDRGPALVEQGLMLATALAPVIGYDQAAAIAKEAAATGKTIREIARQKTMLGEAQLNELLNPEKMV